LVTMSPFYRHFLPPRVTDHERRRKHRAEAILTAAKAGQIGP